MNHVDERTLTTEERAAWVALVAVVELLPGVLDTQLRQAVDLTHFDYQVLAALAETTDPGLPMTALAACTNATLTRLSHAVRRMEDRGLVHRSSSVQDGRVTIARLTAAGRDAVAVATPGHVDTVRRQVLDALTPSQVAQLHGIGDALRLRLSGGSCSSGPPRGRPR
jgi:DNA-binding MarR family transcriptional regulator